MAFDCQSFTHSSWTSINLCGPCQHMEEKKAYPESSLRLPCSFQKIYFLDVTHVLLISFFSEDLSVSPHELLKGTVS